MKLLALVATAPLALAACGSPESAPSATAPTTASPTATAIAAPFTFDCDNGLDVEFTTTSIDEAFKAVRDDTASCQATNNEVEGFTPDPTQAAAVAKYGSTDPDENSADVLADMYTDCMVSSHEEWMGSKAEMAAAVTLCPESPNAKNMRLYADGQLFSDGTYKVGKNLKPGTYKVYLPDGGIVKDCYWDLTTKSGSTIRNAFIPSAPRVSVTIPASAYGFSSEGCGWWIATR